MNTNTPLYPDFTLTANNCHEEPIHRPIAIQGHGHMLVLGKSDSLSVHALSDSLPTLLQVELETLWQQPIEQWLPTPLLVMVRTHATNNVKQSVSFAEESSRWISRSGAQYDVIIHQNQGCIIVEWEIAVTTVFDEGMLAKVARRMANASNHKKLFSETTELIAQAFNFDRVMVYKFDKDNHGSVVGETKKKHLEPFFGLHYPESDIPKMARELFLKIKSRFISDIHIQNSSLLFNPALGPQPPHLDLSFSQLRATSPIHIEYLDNMRVTGTLSISIVLNGKLWGLIACHHYSPKQLAFNHRVLSETIGDLLAKRILEIDIEEKKKVEAQWRITENNFLERVRHSENYRIEILQNAPAIVNMCDCTGAAMVTLDDCPYTKGDAPDKAVLIKIRQWLVDNKQTGVFNTANAQQDLTFDNPTTLNFGGLLAVCVSLISESYIFWFRPLISQSTDWAGDPDNSYSVSKSPSSDQVRISPRQSFQKWKVTIDGRSTDWEENSLEMARRLRDGIFRKELVYSAMIAKRTNDEFMQLTFAAAHDLQEPLRTQANYLELIEETLNPESNEEVSKYLNETIQSGARMKQLIADLLSYSRLSGTTYREPISLNELLDEVIHDLSSVVETSGAIITSEKLPNILADKNRMKQLLQNLLTNAIKYVAEGTLPKVQVFMKEQGSFRLLCMQDNGIGISPKDHHKVFSMFQRLHRKNEYEGTGIGLATCKKVAESMDATIHVDSELGSGATFSVRFHQSAFTTKNDNK